MEVIMGIKKILAFLILSLFLLLVGCSDSGQKNTPPGNSGAAQDTATSKGLIDPAALLTKAEAEALLGEPVKEPKNETRDTNNPLGQKICFYDPVSDKETRFIQLSLVQNEGLAKTLTAQKYDVKQLYTETKKMLGEVTDVPGIGDEAFWGTNGLHILKGNVYLNISVGNSSKPENLELAKQVAAKALPRL
jgi:hypothetical protein